MSEVDYYSQDEVDELELWLENLTLKQAFFLKQTYEDYLLTLAHEAGSAHVH